VPVFFPGIVYLYVIQSVVEHKDVYFKSLDVLDLVFHEPPLVSVWPLSNGPPVAVHAFIGIVPSFGFSCRPWTGFCGHNALVQYYLTHWNLEQVPFFFFLNPRHKMSDSDLTLHQPIVEEPSEAELWKQEINHVTRQLSIIISALEKLTELCLSIKEDAYSEGESDDEQEEPSVRPGSAAPGSVGRSGDRAVVRFAAPSVARAGFSAAEEVKDAGSLLTPQGGLPPQLPRFFRFR